MDCPTDISSVREDVARIEAKLKLNDIRDNCKFVHRYMLTMYLNFGDERVSN